MSGTYKIDGALFPENPIDSQWTRDQLGIDGRGVPIFADVWKWSAKFSLLTPTEYNFFAAKFVAGGEYVCILPAEGTQTLTIYSGTAISMCRCRKTDVPSVVFDAEIEISNIYVEGGVAA